MKNVLTWIIVIIAFIGLFLLLYCNQGICWLIIAACVICWAFGGG